MTRDRAILHVDANGFFAAVETVLNPGLRGLPVAVAGDVEDRRGIVLAKSEPAKRAGVKTGMLRREAEAVCPDIIFVAPHYAMYETFSRHARKICLRYSDFVEPFGLDENWIDITGCENGFSSPEEVADDLRKTIFRELGFTVSVGVSFNKIFAKLASDMRKPDAVTVISRENFRETVFRLPASDLLFVGRATAEKLRLLGVHTIGDLARSDEDLIRRLFGKNGVMLRAFANGEDTSPVRRADYVREPKSISHGITCNADLTDPEEIGRIFLELAGEVGRKLRRGGYFASRVGIFLRDRELVTRDLHDRLPYLTRSARVLANEGFRLYREQYRQDLPLRSLGIVASGLVSSPAGEQIDAFLDYDRMEREENLEAAADAITEKYGHGAILPAAVLLNEKTRSAHPILSTLPSSFHAVR